MSKTPTPAEIAERLSGYAQAALLELEKHGPLYLTPRAKRELRPHRLFEVYSSFLRECQHITPLGRAVAACFPKKA